LPGQSKEVTISAHQQIGFSALGEIEERLVVCVPANEFASLHEFDDFAIRKIFGQEFSATVGGELEFWVPENPC
jgi:hypothetical protein